MGDGVAQEKPRSYRAPKPDDLKRFLRDRLIDAQEDLKYTVSEQTKLALRKSRLEADIQEIVHLLSEVPKAPSRHPEVAAAKTSPKSYELPENGPDYADGENCGARFIATDGSEQFCTLEPHPAEEGHLAQAFGRFEDGTEVKTERGD